MTRFAFVFASELKASGLAFIHFNTHSERLGSHVISCLQSTHQQATEKKLLKLVRLEYPKAHVWEDKEHPCQHRYIKIK